MNAFVLTAKENGTLDALNDKWFGKTEPTESLDYDSLTGENGTLKIAVAPDLKPISYIKDTAPIWMFNMTTSPPLLSTIPMHCSVLPLSCVL